MDLNLKNSKKKNFNWIRLETHSIWETIKVNNKKNHNKPNNLNKLLLNSPLLKNNKNKKNKRTKRKTILPNYNKRWKNLDLKEPMVKKKRKKRNLLKKLDNKLLQFKLQSNQLNSNPNNLLRNFQSISK